MINSKTSFKKQSIYKAIPWVVVVLSFLGFLDASYLAIEHYLGGIPPCSILAGCETVLTSSYAEVFGVPVALFGALYYFAIFMSTLLIVSLDLEFLWILIAIISSAGLLASAYFVYLQIFVIGAICLYCLFSAIMTFLIFAATISRLMVKLRYERNDPTI